MTHEQKTRLGIFLSIATVIFVAVAGFFIVPKLRDPGTVYRIEFRDISIQGLIVGSLVKYRGVEVGRVTRIEVSPTSFDTVDVEVKIKPELVVKTDMQVTLVYVGLTGQKYVEISGGTLGSPNLAAHGVIPTAKGLGERADDIVNNIETTAKRITELLSAGECGPVDSPSSTTPRRLRPRSPGSSNPGGRHSRTSCPASRRPRPSSPGRRRSSCP